MSLPCYNLDTRLPRFNVRIALDQAEELIDILAFDAPEDLPQSARVSLVSHGGLVCGRDLGWRQGRTLVEVQSVKAGERLVMAIGRAALMRAVAAFRAQGAKETNDGDAGLDLGFSTIVETPQGTRASPRRQVQVVVLATASVPEWRIEAGEIDLDASGSGKLLKLGRIVIVVPKDIVLEPRRGLSIELGCAGFDPLALSLAVAVPADPSVSLRRYPDAGTGGCRHLLWLSDAAALAGATIALDVALDRDAVIDFVDETAQAGSRSGLAIRLTARLAGWLAQSGAEPDPSQSARPWRSGLEARSIPVRSREDAETALVIAGQSFGFALGGETALLHVRESLSAEVDPDDDSGAVRCNEIAVTLRRWPLTRAAPLTVTAVSRRGEARIAEPPVVLAHEIMRDSEVGRRGGVTIPMAALSRSLSDAVRAGGRTWQDEPVAIDVTLASADDADHPVATATLKLAYVRRVHRMPVCIDLGASATAIWAGPARPSAWPTQLYQLPLGDWLARHVDPRHDEAGSPSAGSGEDGRAALIPSHVGLDSANHLRAHHAPHTLPDLNLIGADREAVARRIAAFGRRYDVSVPAPPHMGISSRTRRIGSLKGALTAGLASLTLDDAVQRLDPATGRLVATHTVEVAPLVADVLDELIDLYVLRLGEDRLRLDDISPPPVVPRILIGRPSGIGQEIAARYDTALALFVQRLERLFPGAGRFDDVARTVPEAVAASRYFSGLPAIADLVTDQRETLLVTLDIGGSGSDVALSRLRRESGRLACTTLATFGLPIGGDRIDEALVSVAACLIDRVMAEQGGAWQPSFAETSLQRACSRKDAAAATARAWLVRAVQSAKSSLSARLLAKAEARADGYRWHEDAPDETFDLMLAQIDGNGEPAGLFVGQGERWPEPGSQNATPPDIQLMVEAPDAAGTRRLVLKLGRRAIETGGGAESERLGEICAVLGGLLPRMARAAAHNPTQRPEVVIASSGRAALWPPLFEAIAGQAQASGNRLAFERPLSPAMMKKAMVAGAAIIGMEGEAGSLVAQPNPLAIAAMAVRMRDLGGGGLRTEFSAERIHYLGYDMSSGDRVHHGHDASAPSLGARVDLGRRFQFVRTVPGLDPQGRILERLQPLLDDEDPMVLLEGHAVVEAQREGLDLFGLCRVTSETEGTSRRRITICCVDESWEGCWRIAHDRVVRVY